MQPIQRKSLAREVADTLKHRIKSGMFAVDSKLPAEPELMEKFGVGRSTIREAIQQLMQSGFVKVKQGLGTFVISSTGNQDLDDKIQSADFAEVFEVRQILEIKIIEKAALHRQEEHLRIMKQCLKERLKYAEAGDLNQCIEADISFHIAVAESCGNTIMATLYKTLSAHVKTFFFEVYEDTQSFIASQQLHEKLVQAISDKDSRVALSTARKIIGSL